MSGAGSLVCVGVGMTLGSHLTPLSKSYIEKADVVFTATSDGIIEMWLTELHPEVRSFQPLYREGKSRMATYRQVLLYRAATLPTQQPCTLRRTLAELPEAEVDMHMTLVVPPVASMQPNVEVRERLAAIELSAAGNA